MRTLRLHYLQRILGLTLLGLAALSLSLVACARELPDDLADRGSAITLEDFQGRWLILEFWGYW